MFKKRILSLKHSCIGELSLLIMLVLSRTDNANFDKPVHRGCRGAISPHRPPNVPQRYADQAAHARYAVHARTFLLGGFVSIENKGAKVLIPKLDVAGSIPVARSIFPQ